MGGVVDRPLLLGLSDRLGDGRRNGRGPGGQEPQEPRGVGNALTPWRWGPVQPVAELRVLPLLAADLTLAEIAQRHYLSRGP